MHVTKITLNHCLIRRLVKSYNRDLLMICCTNKTLFHRLNSAVENRNKTIYFTATNVLLQDILHCGMRSIPHKSLYDNKFTGSS